MIINWSRFVRFFAPPSSLLLPSSSPFKLFFDLFFFLFNFSNSLIPLALSFLVRILYKIFYILLYILYKMFISCCVCVQCHISFINWNKPKHIENLTKKKSFQLPPTYFTTFCCIPTVKFILPHDLSEFL